jgi:hypothetical protein
MLANESVLHYIWKYRLFNQQELRSTLNQPVQIVHTGTANLDAGPDFYHAKIKIEETLWAGNVEIHLRSSDWYKHSHDADQAYDNVILHVVWINDVDVYHSDRTVIPVLELQHLVNPDLIHRINALSNHSHWIACEHQLKDVDDFVVKQWLDRMLVERLQEKSDHYKELFQRSKGNWEDTFYIGLARSFGFKVNSLPFEMLAKCLPQQLLAKHKDQPLQIEALVFGVAGLLDSNFKDEYPQQLKKEYAFLKAKYQLIPIDAYLWKFAKTRPDNFPTIRLGQFAALIIKSVHLFSKIMETKEVKSLKTLFNDLPVNPYWRNHYLFDQEQKRIGTQIGEGSVDVLLINTVAPLLYLYGRELGKEEYLQKAEKLLFTLKAEKNIIVDKFALLGVKASSSFESQALLQMKNNYCNQKKCLNCSIGIKILKA